MDESIVNFFSGALSAALVLAGVVFTAKTGSRTTREGNFITAWQAQFDQLQEEVRYLREKLFEVDAKLDAESRLSRKAINFIDRIGFAIHTGGKVPRPDGQLADVVDMSFWEDPVAGTYPDGEYPPYHD